MARPKDFQDEFYSEAMTEMAGNFFGRRKEMERRLEGLAALAQSVRLVADKALRHWGTFFALAVDQDLAQAFLRQAGSDLSPVACQALGTDDPWRFKAPFAFTDRGRYRKCLAYAYQAAREATRDYREGTYAPDTRDPRRKVLVPNYTSIKDLVAKINVEVAKVNAAQSPSTVLGYARSMDPVAEERESVTGGMLGGDITGIDRELAFKPVDFASLNLPDIPTPPPLDEVSDALSRLADTVFDARPQDALAAMAAVANAN